MTHFDLQLQSSHGSPIKRLWRWVARGGKKGKWGNYLGAGNSRKTRVF